jgi:hypothetical protein
LPSLRGFDNRFEDSSFAKRFVFRERQFIEVRSDWFNAFNRINLVPSGQGSASSGRALRLAQ